MEAFELILLLLAAVLVSSVIDQFVPKISSPLIQIALGFVIAVAAGEQIDIELDSELFLVLFIAPLLYLDAREADKAALWKNVKPVLSLAIGLVILTAVAIGAGVHTLIPSIPITAAIALGAALGPTDAVAVASLQREISMTEREHSLLKGECLINDASGIVSFQFAVAACATGAFSFSSASLSFAISFFGGLAIGAVLGALTNVISEWVRSRGLESTTFHVLFDIFTPFIIFLAAEPFGASGVIAVVTAGLVSTMTKRRVGPSASRLNIVSSSVWRTISFTLNGIVFVLLGTQLPKAMGATWQDVSMSNFQLMLFILVIALSLELIRFIWLMGLEHVHDRKASDQKRPALEKIRSALIMTLAGPKGTITLSIALTIPLFCDDGSFFPQRNLIIFLACGVILVTLLLANFVLPLVARKPDKEAELARKRAINEVHLDILRGVIEEIDAARTPESNIATQSVIRSYNERIERIKAETEDNGSEDESIEMRDLRRRMLNWERERVHAMLLEGETDEYTASRLEYKLTMRSRLITHTSLPDTFGARLNRIAARTKSSLHRTVNDLPGPNISDQANSERQLELKAVVYACGKLRELLQDSGDISTESISKLLNETDRLVESMRARTLSVATIAKITNNADDIQRHALVLERDAISDAYLNGLLTRAEATKLREGVMLMQLDLEERI